MVEDGAGLTPKPAAGEGRTFEAPDQALKWSRLLSSPDKMHITLSPNPLYSSSILNLTNPLRHVRQPLPILQGWGN